MTDSLVAGGLLARRYRLVDQVGAGGMSVIWRARDEVLDRIVALKVLAPTLSADPQLRRLVRDEARAAARLVHPHVTAVYDYGEDHAPDGTPVAFVVHELLSGESLAARLTDGPLPWPEAVEVGAQVAEALAAAHRLGIVHRDVTPDNVMLTPVGAKVLDFGIATRIGAPDDDEDGGTFGTPTYVAPERLDGVPARPAADVFALGMLLYEMLSGRPPYRADTWEDLTRVSQRVPPLPNADRLPGEVARRCEQCLSRDPAARPTAAQVARGLRAVVPRSAPTGRWPAVRIAAVAAAVIAALVMAAIGPSMVRDGGPGGGGTGHDQAVDPPAPAVSVPPTMAGATAPPAVTGPPAQAISLDESLTALAELIDARAAAGEIRADVALDLRQQVDNLRRSLVGGRVDIASWVVDLRGKVAVRLREGGLSQPAARALDASLATVAAAAR